MIQPIYLYGSEVLRKVAGEADLGDPEAIRRLVTDLKETLAAADGCGLAAPQIGVSRRVVIVDGTVMADVYPELKTFRRTLINPTVLEESAETCVYNEGCLSIPEIFADVRRPAALTVRYYNEALEKVTERLEGFACRMVQHELSHLDGRLFVDDVAPIRKKILARRLVGIAGGRIRTRYKSVLKK